MVNPRDEYLHEGGKGSDWIETFSINFVDKKSRLYGFADVNYYFQGKKAEFNWALYHNEDLYSYYNQIDFDKSSTNKTITDKRFKYRIITPAERFEMSLRNESLSAEMSLTGVYPVYVFPSSIADDPALEGRIVELWQRYEQRCKLTGGISFTRGPKKGSTKRIECVGLRKHSWGNRYPENMSCCSWITIQFRDMAMDLTYMEIDGIPRSNGFISKRTGNIPIVNVEMELLSFNRENKTLMSTEFSYRDASDDRDLIVSKRLHVMQMPLPRNKRSSFIRIRAFSDFTIIGTNKKGVGMEDHFISIEKLKQLD